MNKEISFEVHMSQPYEDAVETVIAKLKEQGFGVLTRIDVKATLKKKIGVDFRPYVILGACNPPLAHQALESDARVGLMMPCNVTVEAAADGSIVRFANPALMVQFVEDADVPGLADAAAEAAQRIKNVVKVLTI